MNRLALAALTLAPFTLAACDGAEQEPDTSYEEQLPAPVQDAEPAGNDVASVPDNTSVEGGPDEQVDDQYAGENQLPDTDKLPD